MTKPKDAVEIISKELGEKVDVKDIDKEKLRNAVRNLESLINQRDKAVEIALEQTLVCKEIAQLESRYQESLRYDFQGKINEVLVIVSGLSPNRFVKNTLEITEITQLLLESETAKDTPDKLKADIDSLKRVMDKEPDFKELEIQHVTYEIFANMGLKKRLDEDKGIRGNMPYEMLNKLEKETSSYLKEYDGLIRKKTRNLLENALESINQIKAYEGPERHEAETNLAITLTLINSLDPVDETIKDAKRDLFHLQGTTQKILIQQFSQQVEFIDIYDKIPFNQGYVSKVIETAKEVLKCKIPPNK